MFQKKGEDFFKKFRGSFSGIIYDKTQNTWIIYTNHIGDKQVFFYKNNNFMLFSNNMGEIIETVKLNEVKLILNREAAYQLLTFGFMIQDNTLIKSIKKLQPGCYIKVKDNKLELKRYHKFTYGKITDDMGTIIEKLDDLFRKAVSRQFNKDLEYGYKHIANMSGGLDSRMVNWVARDLGYDGILNTTYCKANYKDEIIAKKISEHLGNEFLFKSLDDVSFIYDIENIVRINFGMALYSGITGGKKLYDIINFNNYGLDHTGQLGDVVIGSFSINFIIFTMHFIKNKIIIFFYIW